MALLCRKSAKITPLLSENITIASRKCSVAVSRSVSALFYIFAFTSLAMDQDSSMARMFSVVSNTLRNFTNKILICTQKLKNPIFVYYSKTKDDIELWFSPMNLPQEKTRCPFFFYIIVIKFFCENIDICSPCT